MPINTSGKTVLYEKWLHYSLSLLCLMDKAFYTFQQVHKVKPLCVILSIVIIPCALEASAILQHFSGRSACTQKET